LTVRIAQSNLIFDQIYSVEFTLSSLRVNSTNIRTMDTIKNTRLTGIDALRGIAVILMIEQHMGFWLWKMSSSALKFLDHPFLIGFNAMGGYAAPAFITLAGAGTVFFVSRYGPADKVLVKRGIALLLFGYFLNISVQSWFTAGSWYVLHMIGFGLIISIFLRRLSNIGLFVIFVLILAITVFIQHYLQTPDFLGNRHMSNYHLPGGVFRLALAESQFPLFPWLSLFIAGIISGRYILENKLKKILIMASLFLCSGIVLTLPSVIGLEFTQKGLLKMLFRIYLGFYPANPPIILLLVSIVLFTLVIFIQITRRWDIGEKNVLVCLGRTSLTYLIVHVILFRQIGRSMGIWHRFGSTETMVIIIVTLLILAALAIQWEKAGYRYGAEWIIRKFGGK
jgi:uncharacterized membrane protein